MGPFYITTGSLFHPRSTYKHDLGAMLAAAVQVVRELAHEGGYSFRMAVIDAELDKDFLKQRIRDTSLSAWRGCATAS